MTGGQIAATVVALYLVVAAGVLGALTERERLLNPDGERDWRWVGSLALAVLFWPVLGLLWAESRPAPASPPRSPGVEPRLHATQFSTAEPSWRSEDKYPYDFAVFPDGRVWSHPRYGSPLVRTPQDLANLYPMLVSAYVVSLQTPVVKVKSGDWESTRCACRWTSAGHPVVLCYEHRTDLDPQGEPDDDDEVEGQ